MRRSSITAYSLDGLVAIRNEPVQARSTARLTALLDAAAIAVQEVGYERITTAMVAQGARASIGTVYRYFPDRIAVLQALAARNFDRVVQSVRTELLAESHADPKAALGAAFDAVVAMFRTEPGFSSLRTGDVIDLKPAPSSVTNNSRLADEILGILGSRFDVRATREARVALEGAIEVTDSLVARAFARDNRGDPAFLDLGRTLMFSIIAEHLEPAGS